MNYQKMCDAPMNYQLDQNRAFNYQRQPFFPFRQLKGLKETVTYTVLHGGMLEDGGSSWGKRGRWW
jgi:hypothetical protein